MPSLGSRTSTGLAVRAKAVVAHDRTTRQNRSPLDLRSVALYRSVPPKAAVANESRMQVSLESLLRTNHSELVLGQIAQ